MASQAAQPGNAFALDAYLRSLYQTRELVPVVERFCTQEAVEALPMILTGDLHPEAQRASIPNAESTGDMVTIAELVLQNVERSEADWSYVQPSTSGRTALDWISHAIFAPAPPMPGASLMRNAQLSSPLHAHQVASACAAALALSMRPTNCLSLLRAATIASRQDLYTSARAMALASFTSSLQQDPQGWSALPLPEVASLLSDDTLQVSCEAEVVHALLQWVAADAPARAAQLAPLAAACVRVSSLTLKDLELLDAHPLVTGSEEATKLVAGWYLAAIFGGAAASGLPLTVAAAQQRPRMPAAAASCGAQLLGSSGRSVVMRMMGTA